MKRFTQLHRRMRLSLFVAALSLSLSGLSQNSPPLTFMIHDSTATIGYYFMSPYTNYASALYERPHLILDRFGRIIWYRVFQASSNMTPTIDFKLQPDGRMSYFDINKMKFFLMDSTFMVVDSIACINGMETDQHDMQVLPDNHFLLFGVEYRTMNLSSYHWFGFNHNQPGSANALVGGVIIQEFDEGKDLVWEWKGHDHYQFGDADPTWFFNPNKVDWTHANAVERDLDGNILISLRHFNEVTKINRETGEIIWRLGGKQNQFSFPNDPVRFTGQHDIRRVSDTSVSLFDNGQYSNPSRCRALEYALDETNKVATLVWDYIYDSAIYSVACGNHQFIANGNHLVDFGFTSDLSTPWMVVVKPDKTKVLEVSMPNGYISYRAFNYPALPWQLRRPQVQCQKIGSGYYLVAEEGFPAYRWSTGETTPDIEISDTGEYWVFVPYGMGFISSEHIRITDMKNPCLFTGMPSPASSGEISLQCLHIPATNKFRIVFELPQGSFVRVTVYDLWGNEINKLVDGFYATGVHEVTLDGSAMVKGMYLLSMVADQNRIVRKVIIR